MAEEKNTPKENEELVEEKNVASENDSKEETKKEKKSKSEKQIAKLEADIEKLKSDNASLKNEYLKVFAEMENTKKRLKDEAIKDRKYASQKVVGELINPIDMLLQIVNMPSPSPEIGNYVIGFQMITNQLIDILKGEGLAPIEALNKEFDPNKMHAVEVLETEDSENMVVKVNQAGYMYKDRVLRPAMVVVTKKKEAKVETEASNEKKVEEK